MEVTPVGYEWVRDDTDAPLIDVNTDEVLQVEYGVVGSRPDGFWQGVGRTPGRGA
jgi:hypothetical protein